MSEEEKREVVSFICDDVCGWLRHDTNARCTLNERIKDDEFNSARVYIEFIIKGLAIFFNHKFPEGEFVYEMTQGLKQHDLLYDLWNEYDKNCAWNIERLFGIIKQFWQVVLEEERKIKGGAE